MTARAVRARSVRAVSTAVRSRPNLALVGTGAAAAAIGGIVWGLEDTSSVAHSHESTNWVNVPALVERVRALEVALAGKTNSAFVFIKPHACKGTPGKVETVVEEAFAAAGIRITAQGDMSAETIDKNMHIDTHYGAIASKAVKLKPAELNVPDKGKAGFQKMFGLTWEEALAQGKVYNATDAADKLGVDGQGLEKKWRKLTKGKDLIKFGGGFYCGQLEEGTFVMNGFYMSMR